MAFQLKDRDPEQPYRTLLKKYMAHLGARYRCVSLRNCDRDRYGLLFTNDEWDELAAISREIGHPEA